MKEILLFTYIINDWNLSLDTCLCSSILFSVERINLINFGIKMPHEKPLDVGTGSTLLKLHEEEYSVPNIRVRLRSLFTGN